MAAFSENERALVNAIDEPAFIVAGNLVVVANPAAQILFGEQVEGRDVRLAIRHPEALELILSDRSGDVDVSGIVEPGRSWRMIIRRLSLSAAFIRMIDRSASVSAEKMRVDFVANASHELRTPLSTVMGYAETLAEEGDLPDEMRVRFGRTIRDEARRMLRIVEDLMSLSRIEADRFLAPNETVEIGELLASAAANAAYLTDGAGCQLRLETPQDMPPVRGDRAQLLQLLDNLIGNAVRYGCGRPNSVIELQAKREGSWNRIEVLDHGPGIAREHLPRLTERFYRADPARSRERGGTGLGLAIVKHIVERHRGLLEIRSEVGVGTSVSVRLPAASEASIN